MTDPRSAPRLHARPPSGSALYLVDTSAWIPVLRQRRRAHASPSPLQARVDELLAADQVATTGIVRTELLVGTPDGEPFERLRSLLDGLQNLEITEADWDDAGRLGQRLRLAGETVQTTDLIIAAVALRHQATVLHRDDDFERIARHAALKTESHL